MSDKYAGSIRILKSDILECKELQNAIKEKFYDGLHGEIFDEDNNLLMPYEDYVGGDWDENGIVAGYYDVEAPYGEFPEIERICQENKIPYDRWSDGNPWERDDYPYTEYYRPETGIETKEDIVEMSEIKALLDNLDDYAHDIWPTIIGQRLIDFVNKKSPKVKPLEEYENA